MKKEISVSTKSGTLGLVQGLVLEVKWKHKYFVQKPKVHFYPLKMYAH